MDNLKKTRDEQPPYNTIIQTGMVALFEICFEQAWKAMKELLEQSGYSEARMGSPRSILKLAYQAGMIDNETEWLQALKDRNDVTHSYNEMIALRIIQDCREKYLVLFEQLQKTVEEKWL
ncbi:HI0074 family nucleotidyltransferase substrate-binding subunit [uncultured Acidaminococcus sp.]|uniref:HI0074 family nucleotidyltransferase substrate-binding subunit n=1 Tax=uncultured Acidaminococcus sp. TaxID=352152 RepID=UPI002943BD1D|nr:HI0074 family nucleotidyltransferase substrate-binding subunit [uncultured Acidaminococcus sp.]